jgi:hypothetical protein
MNRVRMGERRPIVKSGGKVSGKLNISFGFNEY